SRTCRPGPCAWRDLPAGRHPALDFIGPAPAVASGDCQRRDRYAPPAFSLHPGAGHVLMGPYPGPLTTTGGPCRAGRGLHTSGGNLTPMEVRMSNQRAGWSLLAFVAAVALAVPARGDEKQGDEPTKGQTVILGTWTWDIETNKQGVDQGADV